MTMTKAILRNWILPPNLSKLIKKNISNFSLPTELNRSLSNNKVFRDCHKGERCFILATGPSINEQDLSALKNEICFSLGEFYHHKAAKSIKPRYHVEAPNHDPFNFKELAVFIENFKNHLSNETTFFLGHTAYQYSFYNYFKSIGGLSEYKINYLNYSASDQLDDTNYLSDHCWDITSNLFGCRTVVYSAIQIATYMGFKSIYLVGCDHDYLIRYFNKDFKNHHFYTDDKDPQATESFLDSFSLERWFEEYYYRWKQYRLMNEYLQSKGCEIVNATKGGMLNVFPRINLEDVLSSN